MLAFRGHASDLMLEVTPSQKTRHRQVSNVEVVVWGACALWVTNNATSSMAGPYGCRGCIHVVYRSRARHKQLNSSHL